MLRDHETKGVNCLASLIRTLGIAILLWLLICRPVVILAGEAGSTSLNDGGNRYASSRVVQIGDRLPLYFVENGGHIDPRVAYYVQASDKVIYFTSDGVTLVLSGRLPHDSRQAGLAPVVAIQRQTVKLDFVGANRDVRPSGEALAPTLVSYFKGPQNAWKTGLKTYTRLVYTDLWPGIDLIFSGTVSRLKYMFVVKPGADPNLIKLAYRGASHVSLDEQGRIEVRTELGSFHDDKPSAYQEVNGTVIDVDVGYKLSTKADNEPHPYSFRLGSYDSTMPLIIDPAVLVYAGFIGGSGDDRGNAIAVDAEGNAYITGETNSSELTFPKTVGPDLTYNGGVDAFVAKVDATGTALLYAGFIGGAGDDRGNGIAVDDSGNAYIVGETASTAVTFPAQVGPSLIQGGGVDAFVAKVNAAGTALVYAGYIGGDGDDRGKAIALEPGCVSNCSAYVTGETTSAQASFPETVGPDPTYNGGVDAFVAKVKSDGTGLVYAGYIGGSGTDRGNGIAVDAAGNAYVIGETDSPQTSFPVTVGPDPTYNGGVDAFVAKVKSDGTGLDFAGYIGGSGDDRGKGIALGTNADVYIVGETNSSELTFPAKTGPDTTQNLAFDAFVAKLCNACADLSVTQSHFPTGTVSAGSDVTYTITVTNNGPDDATGVTIKDTLPKTVTLPSPLPVGCVATGTVPVTVDCDLGNLNNGFSAPVTIVVKTTAVGTLVNNVIVLAAETDPDPSNNSGTDKTVVALPNLTITSLQAPKAVMPGSPFIIQDTTKNKGQIEAGASTTRFYLSTDKIVGAGDVVLANRPVPALMPSESNSFSTTATIDAATALGRYFLIGVPDVDNVVAETNDTNKTTRAITVTLPDLVISGLRAPSSAAVGATITAQETTSNKGRVDAGTSDTRFYLSTDSALDAGDVLLGSRAVPALGAKGKNTAFTNITIPLGIAPGKYFLIAVCDGADAVVEINESNNTRSKTITITP
jgi:uncharacterized repeat protein (TIGR01451 family)